MHVHVSLSCSFITTSIYKEMNLLYIVQSKGRPLLPGEAVVAFQPNWK